MENILIGSLCVLVISVCSLVITIYRYVMWKKRYAFRMAILDKYAKRRSYFITEPSKKEEFECLYRNVRLNEFNFINKNFVITERFIQEGEMVCAGFYGDKYSFNEDALNKHFMLMFDHLENQ